MWKLECCGIDSYKDFFDGHRLDEQLHVSGTETADQADDASSACAARTTDLS